MGARRYDAVCSREGAVSGKLEVQFSEKCLTINFSENWPRSPAQAPALKKQIAFSEASTVRAILRLCSFEVRSLYPSLVRVPTTSLWYMHCRLLSASDLLFFQTLLYELSSATRSPKSVLPSDLVVGCYALPSISKRELHQL